MCSYHCTLVIPRRATENRSCSNSYTQVVSVAPVAAVDKPKVSVTSTPAGADIEINGNFVGSTPSNIEVDPGKNEVKITKKGFAPWSRTLL